MPQNKPPSVQVLYRVSVVRGDERDRRDVCLHTRL
jgi:hypothetical protein